MSQTERKINTVNGVISPEKLGVTDLHEHTFLDLRVAGEFMKNYFKNVPQSMLAFQPENFPFLKTGVYLVSDECAVMDDMDFLIKEYSFLKALGTDSIVDCSPCGVLKDIKPMQELSKRTGLNIICATGVYTETSRPKEWMGKDETFLYPIFKKDVEEGIGDSGIRPGILKSAIATIGPDGRITDGEIAGVKATARLSGETGLSVHIHTDPNIPGEMVVAVAKLAIEQGAKPEKIHICHMDNRLAAHISIDDYMRLKNQGRNINLDVQKELLDLGVTIGFDTWGMTLSNPQYFVTEDYERVKGLVQLIEAGYEDQLTIGCDFSSKLFAKTYGGYGATRFMEYGAPMLRQLGYEKALQKILVENPVRILAYEPNGI
ncbi:MAG: hypothetical protein K6E64_04615 [Lachnospiraceae bacterium]|nr:hypothetical protein [Lachnospiraceae bacterium]